MCVTEISQVGDIKTGGENYYQSSEHKFQPSISNHFEHRSLVQKNTKSPEYNSQI